MKKHYNKGDQLEAATVNFLIQGSDRIRERPSDDSVSYVCKNPDHATKPVVKESFFQIEKFDDDVAETTFVGIGDYYQAIGDDLFDGEFHALALNRIPRIIRAPISLIEGRYSVDVNGNLVADACGLIELLSDADSDGYAWARADVPKLGFAIAPASGLPARTGVAPGVATCEELIIATNVGANYQPGDFIRSGRLIIIKNWGLAVVADEGDRMIQHDGRYVVGFICDNDGDAEDFELLEAT